MDSKRTQGKAQPGESNSSSGSSSSGESSCGSPASPASSPAAACGKAPGPGGNAFANDGSFMEMFKKKMEEEKRRKELEASGRGGGGGEAARSSEQGQSPVDKKPAALTSFVGKRRGGVFLKTGMVAKKQKSDSEVEPGKSDAWSKYMAEVKKYKAHQCGDDDKTRPLVK